MKTYTFAGIGLAVAVAGCSSSMPSQQEMALMAAQKQQEAQTQYTKIAVEEAPPWYLMPPNDKGYVYGAGTATSADMQFATDKAALTAKRMVADQVHSKLSADLKDYLEESGGAALPQASLRGERVIRDVVAEVDLVGFEVVQRKVVAAGTGFRAFVLIRYPVVAIDRQVVSDVKQDGELDARLHASKAFQDLEKEIQDARTHDQPATAGEPPAPVPAPRAQVDPAPAN
jgi:hypothetical protein